MKIQKESRPRSRPRKYQIIFVNENMDYVRKVEELKFASSPKTGEIFAEAELKKKKNELLQIAEHSNALGPEAIEIFNSHKLIEDQKNKYDDVL